MANIITTSDIKKFLKLAKVGIESGRNRELSNYTSITHYDGTDVPKEVYVSIELRFLVDGDKLDRIIQEDVIDNEVKDLLSGM